MVVSEIMQQDRNTSLYTMPESHKEELKVRAPFAPILSVLGKRTDLVKSCCHTEGPYGRFMQSNYVIKEVCCQQLANFNFLFLSCLITLKQLQIFS